MEFEIHKCPNCGNNRPGSFYGLGADDTPTTAILDGAIKQPDNRYKTDEKNGLVLTPYVCKKCSYVMLFRTE